MPTSDTTPETTTQPRAVAQKRSGALRGAVLRRRTDGRIRAQARAAVQSEHIIQQLFDTMSEGLMFFDTDLEDWPVTKHNRAAERLMGLTAEQIRRGPPHPDGWSMRTFEGEPFGPFESPMGRTIKTGQPVTDAPVAIHLPDTSRRFFRVTTRVLTEDGIVTGDTPSTKPMLGVMATFAEVTPVMESEQRLAFALEGTQDALWDWRIDAGTVHRSPLWAEMLGYPASEIGNRMDAWDRLVHPDDHAAVQAALDAALAGRTPRFDAEYRLKRHDGTWCWVHDRGLIVVRDREGRPLRMTGSQRDVTERHRQEELLRRAKDAAEASNHAKSEFLARMSHELRTPLNSVLGFAGVLMDNKKGTFARMDLEYVRRIQNNGSHLLGLIDQILDLAKVEAGRVTLEHSLLAVDEIVQETVQQLEGQVRNKPLVLQSSVPDMVAPVSGDLVRLRQVLINLVGNAIKFTPTGTVTIHLEADPVAGAVRAIEVRDTGIGIPADRLQAVFEAFEQAEASTTRTHGGTGLGLAISKQLCDLMGYRLEVTSQVGEGSTFRISFPESVVVRPGDEWVDPTPTTPRHCVTSAV